MKPYSENTPVGGPDATPAQRSSHVEPPRSGFTSQVPAILLTSALVIGGVAWMQHNATTQRAAELEPLRVQNEALKAQGDDNRRQLEATTKLLKDAITRHDGEVFRPEEELQKLNEGRVALLADAIAKKVIPALPPEKSAEESQRLQDEQVDKVATRLTEHLTPLLSRVSAEQAAQRSASAQTIRTYEERIHQLDNNVLVTQAAAQDALKLTQEVSALYLDSFKDRGMLMRLFSLPANLVIDAANLNLVTDRSRAKVQQDLAAKMTELDRRLREVQQVPQVKVASKN